MQKMPLQMLADEIHLRPQQLKQMQAVVAGGQQLIEFVEALIQQARGFADVGLGQVGDPALEVARGGFTEGQAQLRGRRGAQWWSGSWLTHAVTSSGGE